MNYKNPVIRGFYPDPSVCKANGKYYLVCSSFHYFPGVPLFESADLINWNQIGHCLTRESQLPLDNAHSSGGIFAPTIRFYDGRFYMTTTNTTNPHGENGSSGNFYVFTDDIYGEWSEPIYVEQGGIDPSLYFEDGRSYFMSNGYDEDGNSAIIQCEIEIKTGKKLSETKALWGGTGGRYLESPHLYKIGKYYYLTAAEGGTEYGHMVTYARSENLWGDYEPYDKNPVLTNRNLGGEQIQGVGHADLIQEYSESNGEHSGDWWMFHLGFRQIDRWQPFHHLGRETFLMPIEFDSHGWFTVSGNNTCGITVQNVETARLSSVLQWFQNTYNFGNINPHEWCFLRCYNKENYIFGENSLKIKSSADSLDNVGSPSFAGLRQKEFDMELSVIVKAVDGEAGITLYMDENHHYDLSVENGTVSLKLNVGDIKHIEKEFPISEVHGGHGGNGEVLLKITSDSLCYRFYAYSPAFRPVELGKAQTRYLSSEVACGFTGVVIGLYSQHGIEYNEFKDFKLEYIYRF